MSDLRQLFFEEAEELLGQIESLVLELEHGSSPSVLETLFRAVHTLKGSAGIAGVQGVQVLTHGWEDLLEKLRNGELEISSDIVDLLLTVIDCSKDLVNELADGNDTMPPESILKQLADVVPGGEIDHNREAAATVVVRKCALPVNIPANVREQLAAGRDSGKYAYRLLFDFGRNFFRHGHNLDYLLADLDEVGSIVDIVVDDSRVPVFSELDPEDFHLAATVYFVSEADAEAIGNIFGFVASDDNKVELCCFEDSHGPETSGSDKKRRPYIQELLRQQQGALKTAGDDVLPGLLATVREIVRRIAAAEQIETEWQKPASAQEEREYLCKLIDRLQTAFSGEKASTVCNQQPTQQDKPKQHVHAKRPSSFRIQQETASQLMGLAGQLIIAKNSLPYLVKDLEELGLKDKAKELKERYQTFDHITRELQERVMDIWLLPLQEVFDRFPRFVRDTTRNLNKQAEVVISGGDTRLDKTVVDEIYEPLLHIVRNALDHGIEQIEERQAAGKNPAGMVRIDAKRQGERVQIRVSDDGRGIDLEKLVAKALSVGAITADQLAAMDESQKLRLVFLPGLSTKEGASDLSGRGVGMDVVFKKVTSLGGSVHVQSVPGQGTTFTLNFPFTMATSEVLLVQVSDGIYGVPLSSVRETLRVQTEKLQTMHGRPVFLWRGNLIPVLECSRVLAETDSNFVERVMVVLQHNAALAVDRVLAREMVIVKPLRGELKRMPHLMGAAVLGDGQVLLVLNPDVLVEKTMGSEEDVNDAS